MTEIKEPVFVARSDAAPNAPIWTCDSPVGVFNYGRDNTGQHYWQAPGQRILGVDVPSLETAAEQARHAYFEAVAAHPITDLLELREGVCTMRDRPTDWFDCANAEKRIWASEIALLGWVAIDVSSSMAPSASHDQREREAKRRWDNFMYPKPCPLGDYSHFGEPLRSVADRLPIWC